MKLTQKDKGLIVTLSQASVKSSLWMSYGIICIGVADLIADLILNHRLSASAVLTTMIGVYLADMIRVQKLIGQLAVHQDVQNEIQGVAPISYIRGFVFPIVVASLALLNLVPRWLFR